MLHIYDASEAEAEEEAGGDRDLFFGSVMITHSSPRRETVRERERARKRENVQLWKQAGRRPWGMHCVSLGGPSRAWAMRIKAWVESCDGVVLGHALLFEGRSGDQCGGRR